jgi:hypothetical protein
MFLANKYTTWYFRIIETAKSKPFKGRIAPNKGISHSPDAIAKMKISHVNREMLECPELS